MTRRIEAAIAEADRIAALLREAGYNEGATIVDARASGLRDALGWLEKSPEDKTAPAQHAPPAFFGDLAVAAAADAAIAALPEDGPAPVSALAALNAAPPPAPSMADATPHAGFGLHYTAERKALLRTLWGRLDLPLSQVLEQVNALPGPRIASTEALRQGARHRCGLPGSRAMFAAQQAEAPAPAASAPAADPLAGILEEDVREAREMLRNASVGAKALAEYFGWELPRAQEITATLRAEIAAEGKAA
jgi:hypothetical protein